MRFDLCIAAFLLLGIAVGVPAVALGAEAAGLPPSTSNGLRLLEEMQTVITELAEAAKPSVVSLFPINLTGKGRDFAPERVPNAPGSGAGVIITPDGHIITNNHVVGDATEIEVRLSDKSKLIAQVIGKDPDTDLAVLKVTTDHPLPSAKFGDSTSVRVGEWVLAVGNPFGLERTVTLGVVSGIGRENVNLSRYENFIQTDASINPGNSGGPLINAVGEVIGVNSSILSQSGGSIGLGFAIPSDQVRRTVEQLIRYGKAEHPVIGVRLDTQYDGEGVKIASSGDQPVTPGGPADKAGLRGGGNEERFQASTFARGGDVITKVAGKPVEDSAELADLIADYRPGDEVTLEIHRNGDTRAIKVKLGARPLGDVGG